MMPLQIQCLFGLTPADVVAVGLDISWPQPLLLLTSILSSALGFAFIWERAPKTGVTACSYSTSLLLPHVVTLVHILAFRLQGTLFLFSRVSRGILRSLR